MKRNFLKNSLAAFAFSLAIVASFAFSPNNNAEDATIDIYEQIPAPNKACDKIGTIDTSVCSTALTGDFCTVDSVIVFGTKSGTDCLDVLRKPVNP